MFVKLKVTFKCGPSMTDDEQEAQSTLYLFANIIIRITD